MLDTLLLPVTIPFTIVDEPQRHWPWSASGHDAEEDAAAFDDPSSRARGALSILRTAEIAAESVFARVNAAALRRRGECRAALKKVCEDANGIAQVERPAVVGVRGVETAWSLRAAKEVVCLLYTSPSPRDPE